MLFTSSVFLLYFLPPLVLCYYIVPGRFLRARNLILLIFSLIFYGFGGVRYLGLLAVCMLMNYLGGLLLGRIKKPGLRRGILLGTLTVNLGMLGWFKYAGFAGRTLAAMGVPVAVPEIVLPIGISFFTFQGLSYVIDVYRSAARPQKNPMNIALYITLFPQLVAGPIVRYNTVEREIGARTHTLTQFTQGLTRFLFGFGKKMLLANTMGLIADEIFPLDPSYGLTVSLAWIGAVAYTFQIYFDFSGYSDMAIGLGRMFGFHFEENFNYPYIADSVTDFWRRWHISLSTWFRDYLYIPLGGNRRGRRRHIRNLLIVWALTGLWHGANWTFVMWGLYYGVLQLLEKYPLRRVLPKIPRTVRRLAVFLIVVLGWVLFRSDTIALAVRYLGVMFGRSVPADGQTVYYLREYLPEWICCALAALPIKRRLETWVAAQSRRSPVVVLGTVGPMILALLLFALGYMKLVMGSFNPFIYFQF